jgi:HK97 family phage portal protein
MRWPWQRKNSLDVFREFFVGSPTKSGVAVNWKTALGMVDVLACVRVISQGMAQVPLRLYREAAGGAKTPATDHSLYRILHRRPNDWMTSFEFRETLTMHAVLCKGGFAFINRVNGKITELLPITPGSVTVKQDDAYNVTYEVAFKNGVKQGFGRDQIFHLRGPSWDAVSGLEIVAQARESIGLGMALESFAAELFVGGARPTGLLISPGGLGPEKIKELREAWQTETGRMRILTGGVDWKQTGLSNEDAQTKELRGQQTEFICRAFGVFPQMIGHTDKAPTFASAEAFFTAHVIHCLAPWAERWEQTIARDLIGDEDDQLFAKLHLQGLMRGDSAARAAFYQSAILAGWMTRNEPRLLEDLDPLPGLDEPLRPLNMGPGSVPPKEEPPKVGG